MRKIYVLRAFDIRNFRYFTPSPGAFVDEERAKAFVEKQNKEDKTVLMGYEPAVLNEEGAQ